MQLFDVILHKFYGVFFFFFRFLVECGKTLVEAGKTNVVTQSYTLRKAKLV